MSKRIGGFRRKTRDKLKKSPKTKGKISIRKYLQEFKVGDYVSLSAEPAVQGGMYLPRYHGRTATVIGKQGDCYKVQIEDGNLQKTLVVHPVHLKGVKENDRNRNNQ
ncbi:50S ribosomal protein L21e [Candidatus Woesearchaeota archaeon]|nr:50S ribosomal protein L21e [Candidatus Woesearchaeota archaeon]